MFRKELIHVVCDVLGEDQMEDRKISFLYSIFGFVFLCPRVRFTLLCLRKGGCVCLFPCVSVFMGFSLSERTTLWERNPGSPKTMKLIVGQTTKPCPALPGCTPEVKAEDRTVHLSCTSGPSRTGSRTEFPT